MERVISVEEKIRRAEERYERKRQSENKPVAKVTVNDKKDIKLLKKMLIQILVCVAIYLIIYAVYNNKYVFSEDFINKANEILSYDTNFIGLYNDAKSVVEKIVNKNEDVPPEESIGGANENTIENEVTTEEGNQTVENTNQNEEDASNLSQEDQDIINIKNTSSFIKPVQGTISSKFGQRDSATGSVPKKHTGTDIAANIGTKIVSSTDGEVVLASEEGDYRKTS